MELQTVLEPCCKCHKIPVLKHETGDLWYVYCGCRKWDKYEFLGMTSKSAIESWNATNRPMKRTGHPRGKKDEM